MSYIIKKQFVNMIVFLQNKSRLIWCNLLCVYVCFWGFFTFDDVKIVADDSIIIIIDALINLLHH